MKHNFTLRIYKDIDRHPILTDLNDITIAGITLVSKPHKFDGVCMHKSNQKKFKYSITLSKQFHKISGSHSSPTLSFVGEYIDLIIKNFPRYPAFYQNNQAVKSCLDGWGYTDYLNKGFPHQLLYRNIQLIN